MVYLDNAATSYPKEPGVASAMADYVEKVGATINRSSYASAQEAGLMTLSLRERLCRLFNHPDPTHAVLTPGATAGLNMVIKGLLLPGDHCLVSSMEHNAVMRPLVQLEREGVAFERIPCDAQGRLRLEALPGMIKLNTRLVVMAHGSNVCGTVQDAEAVGKICRERGVPFALDAAQTAGHIEVDFERFGLSALVVPGHKGLLGPQGIGALLLDADFARCGLAVLLTDTGGSHADMTQAYAAIPRDMRLAARALGSETLGAADPAAFEAALPGLRGRVPDLALLRAMHFFDENARVPAMAAALAAGDAARVIALARASGRSSFELLQNVCPADPEERGLALALALGERALRARGAAEDAFAVRVHGGGFAGTIQSFVPRELANGFRADMERLFGPDSCAPAVIRPAGVTVLRP